MPAHLDASHPAQKPGSPRIGTVQCSASREHPALARVEARPPFTGHRPQEATVPPPSDQLPLADDLALTARGDPAWEADPILAECIWGGLLDRNLALSRKAFSPLAQSFLSGLAVQLAVRGTPPVLTYRVQANDLARWARLESYQVQAAFADPQDLLSLGHEIHGRRVALPDCRWSDFSAQTPLDLPWLSAPPVCGQEDGNWWQEVTLTAELLPYLRRVGLCLDQAALTLFRGNK